MATYVLRRTLQSLPIFFGISIVVFAIVHLAPGSPIDQFAGNPRVSPETRENLIRLYGLDRPLVEQFVRWITAFIQVWRPDAWGYSFLDGQPVLHKYMERLPATLRLMGTALAVTIVFAIPIGILAAVKQYSWTDKVISTFATIGYAIPSFLLGVYLLYFGGVVLGAFPMFGLESFGRRGDFLDMAWHLVLPVTSLAVQQIAAWARYMRASMLEVLHQDYVRTARAKGLASSRVLGKHALRNALIPVVTLLGLSIPALISGAAITETIFSYPGLGGMFVDAVRTYDYPVVLAGTMIGGFSVVAGNLLADVLYGFVDPRIKY
ncbi:MAG: ABC transporter permease [Chloroflexi bacterium]|nr:ABC transporter permease [Chloroflexota bacterium]